MKYTKENPLKVVTLCSGYDSQCMALDRLHEKHGLEYDLIAWSEIEPNAIQAHNLVYPQFSERNLGDMTKIDWTKVADFDMLTYSTPCQDFSNAGLQRGGEEGSGTRSSLLWFVRNAVEIKRPKFLFMENVSNLVSKRHLPVFNKWLETLESYGYKNFYRVHNATEYGVAQNRKRVFVISILKTDANPDPVYSFPKPIGCDKCVEDYFEENPNEKYFLKGKTYENFFENAEFVYDLEDE